MRLIEGELFLGFIAIILWEVNNYYYFSMSWLKRQFLRLGLCRRGHQLDDDALKLIIQASL